MKVAFMHEIPVFDLTQEIADLWGELQTALQNVLRSGQFILGPNVNAFEGEVADYLGVRHAIAVNSGTDALFIGLKALGIKPGDEVITTPFTFFATAEAISHVGATPVFVDVDLKTFCISPKEVEAAISKRTRAIIPVHLFGHVAEMGPIREIAARHELKVLEDVAQAFGAEYHGQKAGTLDDVGAFSFFPTKNLGAYGDGGLIVTNDDAVARLARMLRAHGSKKKYYNEMVGYNSRLDEMQAAILRVKLRHIDLWNEGRLRVALRYNELLSDVAGIVTPTMIEDVKHVFHQYTVRVLDGRRDELQRKLADAGIGTMVYYPVPVHRLPLYSEQAPTLERAERLVGEVLSLPMWPQISPDVQKRIVDAVKSALR